MNRIATTIVLAAAVSLTGCAAAPVAPAPAPATSVAPVPAATGTSVQINGTTYIPCIVEDYDGPDACFWDAGVRSNGKGHSFVWTGSKLVYTN